MSDTTETLSNAAPEQPNRRRRGNGLAGMLLPELQRMAGELGITGVARLRKGELIAAIQERQGGVSTAAAPVAQLAVATEKVAAKVDPPKSEAASTGAGQAAGEDAAVVVTSSRRPRRRASRPAGAPESESATATETAAPTKPEAKAEVKSPSADVKADDKPAKQREDVDREETPRRSRRDDRRDDKRDATDNKRDDEQRDNDRRSDKRESDDRRERRDDDRRDKNDRREKNERRNDRRDDNDRRNERRDDEQRDNDRRDDDRRDRNDNSRSDNRDDDDDRRGRRRGRFRDRRSGGRDNNRNNRERYNDNEPQVADDDVLIPVAGIIDILDNYAFIRTSGYLAGPNDVYVSLAQVRKHGLRRGDAVTGAVRQPRDGERQAKYNPLVRLDTINGVEVGQAQRRPEFHKLTPLYPQSRLRLETEGHVLTTRVIDLVMPIGKGQRALIVSPPKAGKTMVLQAIANSITTNNPECHLMVVLVDERPEEVTDMQRSVKGEVIASTFDRPPQDHTTVAELAIERAKRLVELGHDVVVLLDSITRLGRAYNLAAPASGRILSGGVDSTALYPPKKFLGAARNIENGGSLTIIATALVETGSTMDTVIFEEFKGTGNAELKLDRRIADKRVFPAVDVDASSTRREEILMGPEELAIVYKLRKVLHALDSQQALDLLLEKLKNTKNNAEFLMQIQKSTPGD